MPRPPLPEPASGFRTGDLMRLALAISFMVLIVLAIMRFRNPATWQWVRNIGQDRTTSPVPQLPEGQDLSEPEPGIDQHRAPPLALSVYDLGQLGLSLAGSTTPLTMTGIAAGEQLGLALLSLEALSYATPIPEVPPVLPPAKPSRLRFVLAPDMSILQGARDRDGFLVEPQEAADNPVFRRERLDADARYHLIALVLEQARGGPQEFLQRLHQDALWNVPYDLLRDKPHRLRGEVIGVRGTLVWVKRFALERGGSGGLPEYIYQGILEQDGLRQRPIWILFTELPENMPPEKDWLRLFAAGTTFVGYYLKVVEIEAPPPPPQARQTNKPRPTRLYYPVLVGYTVELPTPPPAENWFALLLTVAIIVGGIVLVSAVALYLYYRSERPYLEKMAQVRQRAAQRGEIPTETTGIDASGFRIENWDANSGGNGPLPQEPPRTSAEDAPPSPSS